VPTVYCELQKLSDARMWRVRARASWSRQEVSRVFGRCMKGPLEEVSLPEGARVNPVPLGH